MNNFLLRLLNGSAPRTDAGAPVTRFWNIADTGDDSAEILLYGDIVTAVPKDWWTGDDKPGQWITPEGFQEDLERVKDKKNITIKINSCGGDLYTGIAIHNALKALTGHKTVIVEGIAASAASVIMCAGDEVQIYPGSMVMIHGVSGVIYDYLTLDDLKKLQKSVDAAERAIAQIYTVKTGIEVETLRGMMTRETWMVGNEAVEKGFADTLLDEEDEPTVEASVDRKVLLVAGIRHDVHGFHIPDSIRVSNQIQTGQRPEGNKKIRKEENSIMTLEELRAQYPELVSQIESAARNSAIADERARLQAIEEIENTVGDATLVRDAKYGDHPMDAAALALEALKRQAAVGAQALHNLHADADEAGTADVPAAGNDDGEEDKPLTNEQKMELGRAAAQAALKKEEK